MPHVEPGEATWADAYYFVERLPHNSTYNVVHLLRQLLGDDEDWFYEMIKSMAATPETFLREMRIESAHDMRGGLSCGRR